MRLTQVRGIGRWTVEMLLMFRLGRPDVLPVDDFGVRAGFRAAYGLRSMPHPKALAAWGERWRPYRSAAAWYLWRALELQRAGTLPRARRTHPPAAGEEAARAARKPRKARCAARAPPAGTPHAAPALGRSDRRARVGDAQLRLVAPRVEARRALGPLEVVAHRELDRRAARRWRAWCARRAGRGRRRCPWSAVSAWRRSGSAPLSTTRLLVSTMR